ncbi:MAG: GNAT family N-acetyltransferase [Deltaproteobacteria bacterium]|nr:GNAT family N-acetyltransferase [Deltaproteobacteria bacterium]
MMEFEPISIASSEGPFVIRPYQEGDEKAILDLFREVFGQERTQTQWKWKFRDNPFGTQIILCFAPNGDLTAQYAGIPVKAVLKRQEVQVTQLVDSMSKPAYRGVLGGRKGIFTRTVQAFFDAFGHPGASVFLYGFPGIRHFRLGEILLQYGHMKFDNFFLSKKCSSRRWRGHPNFHGTVTLCSFPLNPRIDELWRARCNDFSFFVCRTTLFLNWRFSHPERVYSVWTLTSLFGDKTKGYAIICFLPEEGKARLIDMVIPQGRSGHTLLAGVEDALSGLGCETLETWAAPNHPAYSLLLDYGFRLAPETLGVIPTGRSFWDRLDFEWAASHFSYTMAECDLF